ncbi:MAG: response regulator [Bacteroidota bacterium]
MSDKNILIIDDSNTNLVLLESLFKRNGYNVFSAVNGKQGLDLMEKNIPDLIFLDLKMPQVDGFEFIRLLKKNTEWKNIPVVILSAISDKEAMIRSIEMGVTEYLTKPLDMEQVIQLTKNILDE